MRMATSFGVAAVVGAVAIAAQFPAAGQSTAAPPLVVTAFNGQPAPPYTTPRTPWGDPDLQGVWSSDDASFPVSRGARGAPANAAPQGLYLTDELWASRQKQIQDGVQIGRAHV